MTAAQPQETPTAFDVATASALTSPLYNGVALRAHGMEQLAENLAHYIGRRVAIMHSNSENTQPLGLSFTLEPGDLTAYHLSVLVFHNEIAIVRRHSSMLDADIYGVISLPFDTRQVSVLDTCALSHNNEWTAEVLAYFFALLLRNVARRTAPRMP